MYLLIEILIKTNGLTFDLFIDWGVEKNEIFRVGQKSYFSWSEVVSGLLRVLPRAFRRAARKSNDS